MRRAQILYDCPLIEADLGVYHHQTDPPVRGQVGHGDEKRTKMKMGDTIMINYAYIITTYRNAK